MKGRLSFVFLTISIFLLSYTHSSATHVIGATINYTYQSNNAYKVSILFYRDCNAGNAAAPDSIPLTVRRSDGKSFIFIVYRTSVKLLPLPLPDQCAEPPKASVCVQEYEYSRIIDGILPGYDHYLFFSTRARNNTINNIKNPGSTSETVYTKIPDRTITPNKTNAQFVSAPPSYVCGGRAFTVKDSAYDADGDKITYQFYNIKSGNYNTIPGTNSELHAMLPNIYIPTVTNGFPNITDVPYISPYSATSPTNNNEVLDTTTGQLVLNGNSYGQFVVGIKLKEYRNNVLISETYRDYQFNVLKCPPPAKSVLALANVCNSLTVKPTNSGVYYPSTSFYWKFNDITKSPKDTSTKQTPSYTYPTSGNYTIKLIVNKNNACRDSSTFTIKVSNIKSAFKVTPDTCVTATIAFVNNSKASTNSPITGYKWLFGDGNSSTVFSPTYKYTTGGSYKVKLQVTNSIGCVDSSVGVIKLIQEYPKAHAGGLDTICRNNPTIQLAGSVENAGGGIWTGGAGLFDPDNKTLNAKYTFTPTELKDPNFKLLLTTTQNGKCGLAKDSLAFNFYNPPIISAALTPYSAICANNTSLQLKGFLNASSPSPYGIKWTIGDGIFKPNNSDPLATYILSPAEIASGKVDLTITSTNNGYCNPVSASTSVPIKPTPVIFAGNDTTVCANNANVSLRGTVTLVNKVLWNTLGDGSFSGGTSNLTALYVPGTNDKKSGLVRVVFKTNESQSAVYPQNCQSVSDTMSITITPVPIVDAGSDQALCENNATVILNGSVFIDKIKSTGKWTLGNGTFSPVADSLDISYTPSDSELLAKSVRLYLTSSSNGKCLPVSDSVLLSFDPKPKVSAGTSQVICKNNPTIQLNGSVSAGSTTGAWSGGKGIYKSDSTDLKATYTPSITELNSGSMKLTLSSTNNGKCLEEDATVSFVFTDIPQIDAGGSITACKNNPNVKLGAIILKGPKGIIWTGGNGKFVPNDTTLNAEYQPTPSEVSSGKIILTANATGLGNCSAVNDTVSITFLESPTVNPGTAGPVCANNAHIRLDGGTSTGKGIWSSHTGGKFLPDFSTLNGVYIPSSLDSTNGSVTLKLTSDNNGFCLADSNTVLATITLAPVVDAGPQQTICANNPNVKLNGKISGGASTGIWSGGTNNFQGGASNLNAVYIPSPSEIKNGKVTLTLTSTNFGLCNAVADTVSFFFHAAPILNAGGNQTVCGDFSSVLLSGTSTTNSGRWKTAGTGKFGDSTSMNTTYVPSQLDVDKNSIQLTFTSSNNGNCTAVSQPITLVFSVKPSINAGNDIIFCTGDSTVQLAATGSSGNWSTTTGGKFSPSASVLNAKYIPSSGDLAASNFTLTFTTNSSGACASVKDAIKVTVVKSPVPNPGSNLSICSDQTATLKGSAKNAAAVQWLSSGNGTFTPNDTTASTKYQPSAADIKGGTVTLTLKALSSQCKSSSKSVLLTINPQYIISAGGNRAICSDVTDIAMAGSRSANFPVLWTSSTNDGKFIPSDTVPEAHYVPTSSALASSSFSLTLASKGSGCPNKTSKITVTVTQAPKVDAGSDVTICNDTSSVKLLAKLGNATAKGGFWTTNAGGTLNPNALGATYSPKAGEKGVFKFFVTTTGGICNAVKDSLLMTINNKPTLAMGSNGKVCADADTIALSTSITNATGGTWSVLTGTGSLGNATSAKAFYLPSKTDKSTGLVSFNFKTTKSSDGCKPISGQLSYQITAAPTLFAGGDLEYCANATNIPLTATVQGVDSIKWSSLGAGTFTSPKSLSTKYNFSKTDTTNKAAKIVLMSYPTALCKSKLDTLLIKIDASPKVGVPVDFSVCADTSFISLAGSSSTGSGMWSSDAGSTFSPSSNNLKVKYLPSGPDLNKSKITFTFTSANNAQCGPVAKSMVVTINAAPKVNAGSDQSICSDAGSIQLTASPSSGLGVQWTSSGSGLFSSSGTKIGKTPADMYLITSLDTAAKTVVFVAKTTNNGLCKAVSSSLTVKIISQPFVDAGPSSATICGDVKSFPLTGKIKNTKYFKWSTSGTGKFAPNDSTLSPNYLISSADSLAGKVNLIVSGIGLGNCKPFFDTLHLKITPAPKVTVGKDRTICADKDTIHVVGTSTVAPGVLWTSSGKGKFLPSAATLSPAYEAAATDKKSGSVVLKMAATGIGTCKAVSDSLVVTIMPAPTVDAGTDDKFCASVRDINLTGTVKVATQSIWTTSGSGKFDDSSYVLSAYTPSAADKVARSVTLTLTTIDSSLCQAVSDKVIYTFAPIPQADAGISQMVCKDASQIVMSGKMKNSSIGKWVPVNGTGNFTSEPTNSTVIYLLTPDDTAKSSLTFSYTTIDNGVCDASSDTMSVRFLPVPTVNAGNDLSVCSDAQQVILNGTVENASGAIWSSTGTNPIVATGTNLKAVYGISSADIASGLVKFTLTSQSGNSCKQYSDTLLVKIQKAPVVLSIPSYDICADTVGVKLVPDTSNVGAFAWSTLAGAGMFSPSNTVFSPSFVPNASQTADGSALVTLIANGKGACSASTAKASTTITIVDKPKFTVSDVSICQGGDTVSLNASNDNGIATAYRWSTIDPNSGTFTNNTSLSTKYVTSVQERLLIDTFTQLLFQTTSQGKCKPFQQIVKVNFTSTVAVNAGSDQNTCTNQDSVRLNASGSSEGTWSRILTTGIGGVFSPSATSPTASYFFSADDETAQTVLLEFKSKQSGTCLEKSDTMAIMIHPGPTANLGTDKVICANKGTVNLNADNSIGSKVVWLTNGSGTFSDSTNAVTQYVVSSDDVTSGTVIFKIKLIDNALLCKEERKQVKLLITPAPIVNAGLDLNICANAMSVPINGGVTKSNATTGKWTALPTASGHFGSSNTVISTSLTDTYLPSSGDTTAKKVALLLTADDNGNCNAVSDTLIINFTPTPTAEAGSDLQVCGDTTFAPISAGVSIVGGGTWSSNGKGVFINPGELSTGYVPSDDERDLGATVKLYISSNAQGTCLSVKDSLTLLVGPRPLVDKGTDVSVCGDTAFVAMDGSVSNVPGGIWSIVSGFGHFKSNSASTTTLLSDQYIPSILDLTNGVVSLKLSTTGTSGQCKSASDLKLITITQTPQIEAGSDVQVCANNRTVELSGQLKNKAASGGAWSSSGTGNFNPISDTLETLYVPSSQDSTSGKVTLFLVSTGNGNCKPVKDSLHVLITPSPVVTVSADMSPCADSSALMISGTFAQVTGAKWTTSGIGNFEDATAISTHYFLKGQSGKVFLSFNSDPGYCKSVSSKITLDVAPQPVVNAGPDTTVCADVVSFPLKGTVNSVVTATKWSIADGNSVSSPTSLSIVYLPTQSERDAGAVTFQLESTAQGKCKPVIDAKVVTLQHFPNVVANAGLPQSMCYDATYVTLNGLLYNVQKANWSSLTLPSSKAGLFVDPNVHITKDTTFSKNQYAPSSFEKGNGKDTSSFLLQLTGYNTIGKCVKSASSKVEIFVIPLPQIKLFGSDSVGICADKDTVPAHAEARVGGVLVSGFWTTTGTGVFEPSYLVNNATYRLSENDRLKPSVTLVYYAFGGGCDTVTTTKVLHLVPALPTVDAGPDQKICKNNLIVALDGQVTTAPKYGWSVTPKGGSFTPDSNHLQTVYFPTQLMSQNGAIKLRLRSHGPAACKDVTDDLLVFFTDIPKVNIAADSITICADTDTLSVSGIIENATGGIWTSTGTGKFISFENGRNANYLPSERDRITGKVKLKLTSSGNGNCFAISDSVLLRIRPTPVVTDTAYEACANADSIQLKATSSTGSGFWTSNGTGSFSPNESLLTGISYYPSFEDEAKGQWNLTFTSKDNELCQAVSKTISVLLDAVPVADAGHDQIICVNTTTTLSAQVQPNIVHYSWNKILPSKGANLDSFTVNSGKLPFTSVFVLKVLDKNGCENSDTVVVNVVGRPIVDIPLARYCGYPDSTIYSDVSQVNPVFGTYQWYINHLLQFGQDQSSTQITQTGKYSVVFDIGNCSTSDSTNVLPLPALVGVNRFVCDDSSAVINVSSSSAISYTWRKNSLNASPFNTTVIPQTSDNSISDTTTYYVTAKDANNCLNIDSVIVFTVPLPQFSIGDAGLCAGTPLVLNAQPLNVSGEAVRFSYSWQPGGDTSSSKDVTKGAGLTNVDTSHYAVTVKVGNLAGSCNGTANATVLYFPVPILSLPESRIFCGDEKDPNASNSAVLDAGVSNATYEWNDGETTQSIVVKTEGLYSVKVTNQYLCSVSDSTKMTEKCKPAVYIPTAFSPNGDNNNDYFVVFGNKFIKNFRLRIFNRWGEVIFNVEDPDGLKVFNELDGSYSWDGNYRGKPMPVGVYPFLVTYEGKDEDFQGPYKKEGSVMIIR